ncbi:hypothetical protein RND81_09G207000 [Saponaria officinalis]|uniref:Protein SIEVE ELEMENT OCCLUSION B-like n=1 Tax=Saponaria officinalis TaxID=3572 RepID=A0AAW1IP07_SAPOF
MATNPVTPRQSAVRQALSQQQSRPPMYLSPDQGRALLPRGPDRGLLVPSDMSRPLVPKTEYGMSLPSDDERHLMSRNDEHGMMLPSDETKVMMSWGNEGSIFLASDDHALTRQIQKLHFPDARNVDVRPLFQLVEEIIDRSTQTIEGSSRGVISDREAMEGKRALYGLEEVPELPLIVERISSEISCKILSGSNSHETTLSVLKNLGSFTWEAKVVLTLAAFAMTYGDFWLLVQIYSTNSLAKSMALIKRLPMIVEHVGSFKNQFEATNNLIRAMLETTRCIVEFGELPAAHITAEDPEVKAAMSHFPIAIYWVIRSCVAAATQIATLSSRGLDQNLAAVTEARELANWAHKLKIISEHLRSTLSNLYKILAEKRDFDAYNKIVQIIYHEMHIDNMKVLKSVIYPGDDVPPLYDGPTKKRVYLEVLRRKHVLLLVSGLDISHEELYNLEQSYTESRTHAFEIVWIPVVDRSVPWSDAMQVQLETLQKSMPWYSVHHPSIISNAAIQFFRNDWHFKGRPILVVLSPQGKVLNENAIHMMWIWQNLAFDFTSAREMQLWEQERWKLELLVDNIDPKIQEWIREGKYIFVYGGDDIDWIRKFTTQARAVANALKIPLEMVYVGRSHNKELVRRVCAIIMVEQLSHCWQEPSWVWYFWTRIESMIHSKVKLEKIDDHGDIILQEIQRLHSHDKTHGGWALLSKGSSILVHGPGKIALTALEEIEKWRGEGMEPGYINHFVGHYMKMFPCHRLDFPANVKIPNSMFCSDCRRSMQKYHSFICCHEDATSDAGNPASVVQYEA